MKLRRKKTMPTVTTTKNGFRTEDITFRGARLQSAILDEIEQEDSVEVQVQAPVSLTPEQVKDFYKRKIEVAKDSNEKRLYSQTIQWIDELAETRKKLFNLEQKLASEVKDETGIDAELVNSGD